MRNKLLAAVLIIFVFLTGCGGQENGKYANNNQSGEEKLTYDEDIQDKSEATNTEDSQEQTREEYSGYVNTIGNSFANLNYQCNFKTDSYAQTGRVTSQGDDIYFYELGYIYQLNSEGDKKIICSAKDASSLNIIGDTLYFLEGTEIYSVKINGGEKEELLIKVLAPFIICDNNLYYITSSNVSATRYEYFICRYKINGGGPQASVSVGESFPTLVAINQEQNDSVIFYYQMENYQDPHYNALHYARYYLGSYDFESGNTIGKEMIAPLHNCDSYFAAIPSDNYIYASWYCAGFGISDFEINCIDKTNFELISDKESSRYIIPVNSTANDLVLKANSSLVFASADSIQNPNVYDIQEEYTILREETQVAEVYIVGDYIYYTMTDYHNSNLYRIRIDGTGWEEL